MGKTSICMPEIHKSIKMPSAFVPASMESEHIIVTVAIPHKKMSKKLQEYFDYLRERQSHMPVPDLMIATPYMRPLMVDWLYKTCDFLKFSKKTAFQTILLADSYCSQHVVGSDELGLIYVAALFCISKYDAVPIRVSDMQTLCNGKYKKEDILKTESVLLENIKYQVDNPSPVDFLTALWEAFGFSEYQFGMKNHPVVESSIVFLEVMSMDPIYATTRPSALAAVAMCFALDFCHYTDVWDNRLQRCFRMKKSDVKDLVGDFLPKMLNTVNNPSSSKYKTCQEFSHMIQVHRMCNSDRGRCSLLISHCKNSCFWDTGDIKSFCWE